MPGSFLNFVDYHQPKFYHFSEDSLQLVHWASENISLDLPLKCLDLCAGCGVIGLELMLKSTNFQMDFCEIQTPFYDDFEKNFKQLFPHGHPGRGIFFKEDFNILSTRLDLFQTYDYIFCNPPYFSPRKGRLSSCPQKRICRFFSEENWAQLFVSFTRLLKPKGKAYFLARENDFKDHSSVFFVAQLKGAVILCFDLNVLKIN